MLRVTTIHASSAGASAQYYTRYLADEGPEGDGRWRGREAEALGLAGRVSTDDLEALLSGRDPTTGVQLGAALVDRVDSKGRLIQAVAGFDATFSAPKSLSVWWGLTGDPGLLEAHDAAVAAVLDHLERFGATTRVRVNGSRMHPDTGGLVMGVFRQATSREDDPQLHTHVVVSAKVQTDDGRWMALDARYLKRKQRALGGLYQSVLRAELTRRYGVAWQTVVNGQA
jgi:conjugative relaxase-like TrwC/TraI family protein